MSKVQSIEELKQKCAEKNMPLEKMRFFIGENRKEPKCFGVYLDEDTGNWIVYKNKADGTRAVRMKVLMKRGLLRKYGPRLGMR